MMSLQAARQILPGYLSSGRGQGRGIQPLTAVCPASANCCLGPPRYLSLAAVTTNMRTAKCSFSTPFLSREGHFHGCVLTCGRCPSRGRVRFLDEDSSNPPFRGLYDPDAHNLPPSCP